MNDHEPKKCMVLRAHRVLYVKLWRFMRMSSRCAHALNMSQAPSAYLRAAPGHVQHTLLKAASGTVYSSLQTEHR